MKWYKVSEQLPTKDGDYLVVRRITHKSYAIGVSRFVKDGNKIDDFDLYDKKNIFYIYDSEYGYCLDYEVIYWGELPPLPNELKGKNNDNTNN
jgi:hypothetical protein